MIFNTWVYGLFLLIAVCAYWLAPIRWRAAVLIALGFVFYGYASLLHAVFIAVMTTIVFLVSRLIAANRSGRRRVILALGTVGCLGTLAYFKYQGFLADGVTWMLRSAGVQLQWTGTRVQAPLAISFFTFEYVHYLIEIARGGFAPAGLRDFTLFIMFFPTLVCGPIKRFQQFGPQESVPHGLTITDINGGLERILIGFAKKTLIADSVAPFCAPVLAHPDAYTWAQLWLAVYGYALQIYFDFSGYSDIAIGSARLLGYRVQENFNYPYLQSDIGAFWRNWHMSLTSWITDYVYIPLGGNRKGVARAVWNRCVAMTACGLWHGAAFHFAVWGMYHAVGLNLYRGYLAVRWRVLGAPAARPHPALRVLSVLLTFHFVCIGWVLFVCELDVAWGVILRLLRLQV